VVVAIREKASLKEECDFSLFARPDEVLELHGIFWRLGQMKEIKAYIQRHLVNKVVEGLEQAGAPGITIVEIHPVGYGYEPNYFGFQSEDAFKRYS
jgi:hypothetical protein